MKCKYLLLLLAIVGLQASAGAQLLSLGSAQNFSVLASSTVTSTGFTLVNGNLGVSPGSAVTGFGPGTVLAPSAIYTANAVAQRAQHDVNTTYNVLAGLVPTQQLTGRNLGGLTLLPGVYHFNTSAALTGALVLDAQGDPNALFVFQMGSTLTTAIGSSVTVINCGNNSNVFWQVGSSATLGKKTAFVGNILAYSSVTITTGVSLSGRALAENGAVTMDTNGVSIGGFPYVNAPAGVFGPAAP